MLSLNKSNGSRPYNSISVETVAAYYLLRGLKMPEDEWQSLGFLTTELGEAYEVLLSQVEGWVRNNTNDKEKYKSNDRLAEELGDIIMMAIATGIIANVDPIKALLDKMKRKLETPPHPLQ